MKITEPRFGQVLIELTDIEAIGLYKLVLAHDDPRGSWPDDADIEAVSAALQVQLSVIVGP